MYVCINREGWTFEYLCQYAQENDLKRIEWYAQKWNKAGINFYNKLGAKLKDGLVGIASPKSNPAEDCIVEPMDSLTSKLRFDVCALPNSFFCEKSVAVSLVFNAIKERSI